MVDMFADKFLCSDTVTLSFGSLTSGPSANARGEPTTVVAVCPTVFLDLIWVGNASVPPPLSVWIASLGCLFCNVMSDRTTSDAVCVHLHGLVRASPTVRRIL
jgi:hypothetical protein